MKIGGLQKFSLIDFPGHLSAVVFTQGCNMRCPYCHNPNLVDPHRFQKTIDRDQVLLFLKQRRGCLDGVVLSGGEPTIQENIIDFAREIKLLGYSIKLDTNGLHPEVIEEMQKQKLVHYFAMDIKAPQEKYNKVAGVNVDFQKILQSINLIINSGQDYEFRTTIVAELLGLEDIIKISQMIKGAKRYVLQPFLATGAILGKRLRGCQGYHLDELEALAEKISKNYVQECFVRGG